MSRIIYAWLVRLVLLASLLLVAAACSSTMTRVQRSASLRSGARWVMLPVSNYSETPQAGERVESMLETLLRKGGVNQLDRYPPIKEDDTHLVVSDRQRYEDSLGWARQQRFDYAVSGSVEEWRYKSGIEGEPAVGLSVRIVDLKTDRVLWSGSGARTGGAGDNASGTALTILGTLLAEMSLSQ
jgi:hypothetical protein